MLTTDQRLARIESALKSVILAMDELKHDDQNRTVNLSPAHEAHVREAAAMLDVELPSLA